MAPEQFQTTRERIRADAIAIGQRLEAAKANGARMRQINALISEHVVAWQRLHNFEINEQRGN